MEELAASDKSQLKRICRISTVCKWIWSRRRDNEIVTNRKATSTAWRLGANKKLLVEIQSIKRNFDSNHGGWWQQKYLNISNANSNSSASTLSEPGKTIFEKNRCEIKICVWCYRFSLLFFTFCFFATITYSYIFVLLYFQL